MPDDLYKILGLSKGATSDEIGKAYRTLARKYHPDLNPNDPKAKENFQKIQEAFEVLNDPKKRGFYDQYGLSPDQVGQGPSGQDGFQWNGAGRGNPFRNQPFGGFYGSGGAAGKMPEGMDLDDILQMFGMGGMGDSGRTGNSRAKMKPVRGDDIERMISIPFLTAANGGTQEFSLKRADGKNEHISVKIPAGIETGKKIRLRGQGYEGTAGGKPGDLLIKVQVESHPYFHAEGSDLYLKLPVTLKEAVFGAKIDVPCPKGTAKLTIPAGSSSGAKLRLKGCGIAKANTAPGDLFVELFVQLPTKWSEEDKKRLEALETELIDPPRVDLTW